MTWGSYWDALEVNEPWNSFWQVWNRPLMLDESILHETMPQKCIWTDSIRILITPTIQNFETFPKF